MRSETTTVEVVCDVCGKRECPPSAIGTITVGIRARPQCRTYVDAVVDMCPTCRDVLIVQVRELLGDKG